MKQKVRLHTVYSIKLADSANKGLQIFGDEDWAQAPPTEMCDV